MNDTSSYVIRRPDDLEGLAGTWKAFSQSARIPMQEYAWVRACAATFSPHDELHVVVVTDRRGPIAIAPLVKDLRRSMQLELLGVNRLFEPMDFVYADNKALTALAETVVRSRLPLNLTRLPADSAVVGALYRASRGRSLLINRPASSCPKILLDARWTRPEDCLTASRRSLLRRMRRRAEEMGSVSWEVLTPTPATLEPVLEEAFRVEAACWKGREGTALTDDPVLGEFFRVYTASACEEGILRLCFLRIGGRAAAMLCALEYKDGLWALKMGYDEEFAQCSPGTLLVLEAVRYAAAQELKSFEFLGTVEDWTRVWTSNEFACVSIRSYPLGLNGTMALTADAARRIVGRFGHVFYQKA